MHRKLWMISLVLLAFSANAEIRTTPADRMEWMKIEVPGATCGDGSPYAIFIDEVSLSKNRKERSKRMLIKFQGGGACQDKETCEAADLHSPDKVQPFAGFEVESIFTKNDRISPYHDFSKIFFPYCTGDVFLGTHQATYDGMEVRHHGRHNVEKALEYLQALFYLFDFDQNEEITIYGFSAGAIGTLYHAPKMMPLFKNSKKKAVIVDAPGLHFGTDFWKVFTPELINDYRAGLQSIGYNLEIDNGLIAQAVPLVCNIMSDWNIGVLQSSQDLFMSWGFGKISSEDHEKLVKSAQGLNQLTAREGDNCASWIPLDGSHTYLHMDDFSLMEIDSKSAMQFAWDISSGKKMSNYMGEPVVVEKRAAILDMMLSNLLY